MIKREYSYIFVDENGNDINMLDMEEFNHYKTLPFNEDFIYKEFTKLLEISYSCKFTAGPLPNLVTQPVKINDKEKHFINALGVLVGKIIKN